VVATSAVDVVLDDPLLAQLRAAADAARQALHTPLDAGVDEPPRCITPAC
jgi:hypothetical protein